MIYNIESGDVIGSKESYLCLYKEISAERGVDTDTCACDMHFVYKKDTLFCVRMLK